MKQYGKYLFISALLIAVTGLYGCREEMPSTGEGRLTMNMHIAKPEAKAPKANTDLLADSCEIRIYSEKGLVRYYKGLDNLPAELWLAAGLYRINAVAGDSVPATFVDGYYKGETKVDLAAGKTTVATVTCKIRNTLVTVAFTDELTAILADYEVVVKSSTGELVYTQENADAVGYFMLPAGETKLDWSITGKLANGGNYTQSGSIQNIKAATKYALTFKYNETEYNEGGAYFNLIVNTTAIEKTEEIVIYKRPDIEGVGFDIKSPVILEQNSATEIDIQIDATSALSQFVVSGAQMQAMGLPANRIDLASATANELAQWEAAGLGYNYHYDSETELARAHLVFSATFIQRLVEGNYDIVLRAADMHGKEWSETLSLIISNAVVLTEAPATGDVWAHRATLRGTKLKETSDALTFRYRKVGTTEWAQVDAIVNGDNLSAEVTGLASGTTYEYQAVAGTMASTAVVQFTTETEFVIPNAGFENWHTSGKVQLIYGANETMWWDSGNHGSSTLNVNVTTQDTSIKHSGSSSIKMKSQFVGVAGIGKFAAGNVFAGTYAGTDGTNGILDFGRECNSRPSQLKGYYKYITGSVDYSETSELPKGATDKGNIYIALGDWSAPVHITTKDKKFFNKNDEHIIGFGEIIPDSNTDGDGLVPFTIDIEYRATNRIPTYIIIVASASYYGDYFSGSSSSTMWLDDLELVYE